MSALQRQAAKLAVALLIIGFATGGLLAGAMTGKLPADARAVSGAHLNCLFGCFWLMALSYTMPMLSYAEAGQKRLLQVTAVACYGNWAITLLKSFLHVAGVGLGDEGANNMVFALLNVFVVVPSFAGSGAWLYGLMKKSA